MNKEKVIDKEELNFKEKFLENKVISGIIIDNNSDELIKDLKEFRLKISKEEKVKPYFIFNDKQMIDLIGKMPKSKEELLKASGFGTVKSDKYGESIINILKKKQ